MVKLSMTLRLTISFIAILILACTGISWTLYNALSKELTYRDDMTLINRAAQMQQLLLDGARPENLPLYFNRMVDTKQDILLIHSVTATMLRLIIAASPTNALTRFRWLKTSPAKPYFARRYKARN